MGGLRGESTGLCRITSYNVCYTKLLRKIICFSKFHHMLLVIFLRVLRVLCSLKANILILLDEYLLILVASLNPNSGRQPRITSYNVCYTKLLRSVIPSLLNSFSLTLLYLSTTKAISFRNNFV